MQAAGDSKLSEQRYRQTFEGKILDDPDAPFGGSGGWQIGDKITVSHIGQQFDAIIRSGRVFVDDSGENVTGYVKI